MGRRSKRETKRQSEEEREGERERERESEREIERQQKSLYIGERKAEADLDAAMFAKEATPSQKRRPQTMCS